MNFKGKILTDNNTTTISYPYNVKVAEPLDVTHNVFFGENIKRAIRILKR